MNKLYQIDFDGRVLKRRSKNCMDLLKAMLEKDPSKRMSAIDITFRNFRNFKILTAGVDVNR